MRLLHPDFRADLSLDDLLDVYAWPTQGRYLRANMVSSIDGAARDSDGLSEGISGDSDKLVFRMLRHTADAVIVGAGTAMAENYGPMPIRDNWQAWRAAHDRDLKVPIVVVTNSAHIAPDARVFSGPPGTAIVALPAAAPAERVAALSEVAEVLVVGDEHVDLAALLDGLTSRGLTRLLTEGGPTLLASLLPFLDDLCVTTTPTVLGATAELPRPAPDLLGGRRVAQRAATLRSIIAAGDTLLVSWRLALQ
jgi:riboflavin biosynthesis pyrimidine reductase